MTGPVEEHELCLLGHAQAREANGVSLHVRMPTRKSTSPSDAGTFWRTDVRLILPSPPGPAGKLQNRGLTRLPDSGVQR